MSEIVQLFKDKNKTIKIYPKTLASEVYISEEKNIVQELSKFNSSLDTNIQQLNSKINEVATTGTTTEVLQATTETYIQKKIDDGTIPNMTIGDNTITHEKYKDKSITVEKIDNSVYLNDVKMPYIYPNEFTWKDSPINGRIFTNGTGKFFVNFDVEELKPINTGTTYYVDPINGKDTNLGNNPDRPAKSILAVHGRSDVGEIILYGGVYEDSHVMNGGGINKNLIIRAREGDDVYLTSKRTVTWTKTEGRTNIWQCTRSVAGAVYDKRYVDNDGNWLKYYHSSSLDTVESMAGSCCISGTTVYVHSKDNLEPTSDVMVFLNVSNLYLNDGCTVYLENIKCWGGNYPAYLTEGCTLIAKNCDFRYSMASGSDGITSFGGDLFLQDCNFTKNEDDGISYNKSTNRVARGIEINCRSWNNGYEGGNDNGSTLHNGCIGIRINGAYYQNQGPNIADVGGAQSINLGCIMANSLKTSDSSGVGVASASNGGDSNTKIWLDNCQVFGNTTDIRSSENDNIYIRNTYFVTSNNYEIKY